MATFYSSGEGAGWAPLSTVSWTEEDVGDSLGEWRGFHVEEGRYLRSILPFLINPLLWLRRAPWVLVS